MRQPGYLTVYMALMLGVMISLILGLIAGVRFKAGTVESKCAADAAVNAIMAEYSRGLKDVADVYALDMSYGIETASLQTVENRFNMYASENLRMKEAGVIDLLALKVSDSSIRAVGFITDDGGVMFRKQAIESWEYKHGLAEISAISEMLEVIAGNNLISDGIGELKAATQLQIHEYDGCEIELNGEKIQVEIEDPTYELESLRNTGILPLVLDTGELSTKMLNKGTLYESRLKDDLVNLGNMEFDEATVVVELADKLMFAGYLLDRMSYWGCDGEDSRQRALDYQVEYILSGKDTDAGNLNSVVLKISGIREVANLTYLLSDEAKCSEAEALALSLSAVLLIPEMEALFKTSILLSWAYAESLYDINQLLQGERVPLIKDKDSWHFGLEEALHRVVQELEEGPKPEIDKGIWDGLSYKDYLLVLLAISDIDVSTVRAMNMVEADVRLISGNEGFRMDNCIGLLRVDASFSSSGGFRYNTGCRGMY